MSYDVRNQVALVTGANRGIGKAIVDVLLKHGASKVYAGVRRLESATPLVEVHGEKVVPLEIDLMHPETIDAATHVAGDVSLVVNNAGVLHTSTPLADEAIESLQIEIETNVYGLIRMARAFAPVLQANGGGALVQLNSVASLRAFAGFATYCASKAASYSITQSLKQLLSEQGTAVLSVHPGPIATDMASAAGIMDQAEPPEVVGEAIVAALKSGEFHCYPDRFAKEVGSAYRSYSEAVIAT
ncbi:MAG: SDR family oxidoreductase [Planctomycetales bacterium]|nr:SDR family oxidoreductase [Planctomycetales bacterium]